MGKGIKGDRGVGFHRGNKESSSGTAITDGVTPGVPPSVAGYENLDRPVRHGGQILDLQSGSGEAMGLEINHAQLGSQEGCGQLNHVQHLFRELIKTNHVSYSMISGILFLHSAISACFNSIS